MDMDMDMHTVHTLLREVGKGDNEAVAESFMLKDGGG